MTLTGNDLLLAELTHRINNEFTSAVCIISRAAARSGNDDVKTALAAVSERLMGYALVHRVLQMPTESVDIDASDFMRELCAAIGKSKLAELGIEMIFVDRPLRMDSRRCWRLGLIVCAAPWSNARYRTMGVRPLPFARVAARRSSRHSPRCCMARSRAPWAIAAVPCA
jgi:hypothetical protein